MKSLKYIKLFEFWGMSPSDDEKDPIYDISDYELSDLGQYYVIRPISHNRRPGETMVDTSTMRYYRDLIKKSGLDCCVYRGPQFWHGRDATSFTLTSHRWSKEDLEKVRDIINKSGLKHG